MKVGDEWLHTCFIYLFIFFFASVVDLPCITCRFGLIPAEPLQISSPLYPNQPVPVSLACKTDGPVQKMDPLTNLQVTFLPVLIVLKSIIYQPTRIFKFRLQ